MKNTSQRWRRLGCGLLLVLWFGCLLIIPCGFIALITQQEIVITRGSAPDNNLRIWLVQDAEQRGIGVANGYTIKDSGDELCTATDIHFFLWKGQAPNNRNCTCYAHQGDSYNLTSNGSDVCRQFDK